MVVDARKFAHDRVILLAPLLFELFELGFAHHRVEPGTKMTRHAARLANPFAYEAHRLGQILGSDDNQGKHHDEQQLSGRDIKHSIGFPAGRTVRDWRARW